MFLKHYKIFILLFISVAFFSCTQINVFEKNTPIPNYKWQSSFAATGTFDISDTISAYNLYIVLRHSDAYKYNNTQPRRFKKNGQYNFNIVQVMRDNPLAGIMSAGFRIEKAN
jgi:hypothetical protein